MNACNRALRRGSLAALLAAAVAVGCASPPAWELPPPPPKEAAVLQEGSFERTALESGLELMLLEDHRIPMLSVGVAVPRGAAIVGLDQAGLAAFTAEMMERGAGDRDALELAAAVDDIGASLSVSIDWDSASVVVSGLSRDRDRLLEILGDLVLRPRFASGEAQKARAEQLAGLEQAKDSPETLVGWYALSSLYPGHRYGAPMAGLPASVGKLDAAAARAFYEEIFVPKGALFFASGDFEREAMKTSAEALLGPPVWSAGDLAPVSTAPPAQVPAARKIVVIDRPDLGQARIVLAHEGITRTDEQRVRADLMNKVLGGSGFASRLMQRVRADEGLTYGIWSGFDLRRHPGPFQVSTFTRASEARRVIDLVLAELHRIQDEPPSEDELAKAASLAVGRFGLGLESSSAVLASMVNLALYGLPADSLDTYRSRVRAVSVADTAEIAKRLIHPDRAAIIVLGPAEVIVPQLEDLGEVEVVEP